MNIALIGCGRICKKHIEAINKNGFNLVAIAEIDKSKITNLDVDYYEDYKEMLQREDVDIVSILTPSGMHYTHAIDVIEANKHLIVEKPLSLLYYQAIELVKKAKQKGIKLFTVKQNRYNLPIQKLKEVIDKGLLGNIFLSSIRVRWARFQEYYDLDEWRGSWKFDGGVLSNQAIHHIDLLTYLIGDVESVFAKGINALADIEAEDSAVAVIKFKNGAIGTIEATTAARPRDIEGSISILGSLGSVEVGGFAVNKIKLWEVNESIDIKKFEENPPNIYGFGHIKFYEDVRNSLMFNEKSICEMEEGVKSIKVMNALYESIHSNKEVFLDNLELKYAKIGK